MAAMKLGKWSKRGLYALGVIYVLMFATMWLERLTVWSERPQELATNSIFASMLETGGFNLIGDLLAGIFAPLAFVGLAAAYLAQREQLRITIEEAHANNIRLEKQAEAEEKAARLNNAAVQANYKLNLYGLRKQVFEKLLHAGDLYQTEITDELKEALRSALFDAQFVFPEEVHDWIISMLTTTNKLQVNQGVAKDAERRRGEANWTSEMETKLDELYDQMREQRIRIYEDLLGDKLFDRFRPYMELPSKIEFDSTEAAN